MTITKVNTQTKRKFIKLAPKNDEQELCANLINENDIIIVMGKSGSGKTHISAGMASRALLNKEVDKIILCRAGVGSESLGFLPGDAIEKVGLYLSPILNELNYFIDVESQIKQGKIQIQPVLSMRGMTLKNSFIVVEEFQNCSYNQLKLVLTRFGEGSRMILTGDVDQSDLCKYSANETIRAIEKLKTIATPENRIAVIELKENVRHPIINLILSVL